MRWNHGVLGNRYFACESFYNIAKVCKGEILVFFNSIFDALSKLAADSEISVKNGAELLDRLLKDIVCEAAPYYVSRSQDIAHIRAQQDAPDGLVGGTAELDVAREKAAAALPRTPNPSFDRFKAGREEADLLEGKTFSLARFVPLLSERIYVTSPFTRNFLVSWITVLDSVPQLELVSFLPSFLDGLIKYLADHNADVRVATANVLADFLQEITEEAEKREQVTRQQRRIESIERQQAKARAAERNKAKATAALATARGEEGNSTVARGKQTTLLKPVPRRKSGKGELSTSPTTTLSSSVGTETSVASSSKLPAMMPATGAAEEAAAVGEERVDGDAIGGTASASDVDGSGLAAEDSGAADDDDSNSLSEDELDDDSTQIIQEEGEVEQWERGREVRIDHAAIIEILKVHVGYPDEEIQATALHWLSQLLMVVQDVVVPWTPKLIPAILPLLAHKSPTIEAAANTLNVNLYRVIQSLPPPSQPPPTPQQQLSPPQRPLSSAANREGKMPALAASRDGRSQPASPRMRTSTSLMPEMENGISSRSGMDSSTPRQTTFGIGFGHSPRPDAAATGGEGGEDFDAELDSFDYKETIMKLGVQLISEHEETRISTLEWLFMLHQKAPRKLLANDDAATFPMLLKVLSDTSEEVIKSNLRLLAQISSTSEELYFIPLMNHLLGLFGTDRKLLETRGSLIIRQLCASLNTERIFRSMAEILEKEEDLEFASIMVQNLNIILVTSPELADFRKRLRSLETKDGSALFSSLYRSWSHNPVAAFSLCLLAQAYEHASNLLSIFADLEITVALLIQIDKLVQLLESPVFTSLRLQLLEPERHPFLYKCLYGLLMLLPQSSAFMTLKNRLTSVSTLGFLHSVPRASFTGSGSGAGVGGGGSGSSSVGGSTGGAGGATRSKMIGREDLIRWNELLLHFRSVQLRHERARRAVLAASQASERALAMNMSPETQHSGPMGASGGGTGGGAGGGLMMSGATTPSVRSGRHPGTYRGGTTPVLGDGGGGFFNQHADSFSDFSGGRPMSPGTSSNIGGTGARRATGALRAANSRLGGGSSNVLQR